MGKESALSLPVGERPGSAVLPTTGEELSVAICGARTRDSRGRQGLTEGRAVRAPGPPSHVRLVGLQSAPGLQKAPAGSQPSSEAALGLSPTRHGCWPKEAGPALGPGPHSGLCPAHR